MPQISYSLMAMEDLAICQQFLLNNGATPASVKNIMQRIDSTLQTLTILPKSGRVYPADEQFREKFIRVGKQVYQALYAYNEETDRVTVVAIRSARQQNYRSRKS